MSESFAEGGHNEKENTEFASNLLAQDEKNSRAPKTNPVTQGEFARQISMSELTVTSGISFVAFFDCDEMFTDHAVVVCDSIKKGVKDANIGG